MKIKNKKNHFLIFNGQCRGGFSFIESMLSVFLVSVALVVAMKLLTMGLKDSINSRDQFTASLLAQEGVELVRNIRDNNWVDNDPTKGSFYNMPNEDKTGCRIDNDDPDATSCGGAADRSLYLVGGYYVHDNTGTGTKYFRRIKFEYFKSDGGSAICNSSNTCDQPDSDAASVLVTSMVSWNGALPAVDETNCNTSAQCAYTQITLNKWGE